MELHETRGVAWIDDSNVKVVEVVLDWIAQGLSPEEICDQHVAAGKAACFTHDPPGLKMAASPLVIQRNLFPKPCSEGKISCDDVFQCAS